jgi:hypothetical protein
MKQLGWMIRKQLMMMNTCCWGPAGEAAEVEAEAGVGVGVGVGDGDGVDKRSMGAAGALVFFAVLRP